MSAIADWAGVANDDDLSIAAKAAARAGQDLPEDVDRDGRQRFGVADEFGISWRAGLIDIQAVGGQALMKMTDQQAAAWRRARGV